MRTFTFLLLIFLVFHFISCSVVSNSETSAVAINAIRVTLGDDEEIKMRFYLVKKYNPGDCFGMPLIKNPRYQSKISPELLLKVKNLSSEKPNDVECEKIIRQMERITIKKTAPATYYFQFEDGKCCSIIYYKGNLEIRNDEIFEELLEENMEMVPC
ncbi:MAG: hypothetical protein WC209_07280 [Ignavibacteriaceae bacterium]